jgi:cytochrome c oxidase subunit I+III
VVLAQDAGARAQPRDFAALGATRVTTRVVDVSSLRTYAFGHRSLLWWGTIGIIAIEGSVFALLITSYFYLHGRSPEWPPGVISPPSLLWGSVNLGVLLVSAVPNQLAKAAAERFDLSRTRLWLTVGLAFAVVFHIVRVLEFQTLNVRWDQTAYGSVVWTLLGLHTAHILTDAIETAVLYALLFTRHVDECRFVDVSESALYWYFVVMSWVPIYGVIYLVPRFW